MSISNEKKLESGLLRTLLSRTNLGISGALTADHSGAVTTITVDGLGTVPATTGHLYIFNAAKLWDRVKYTARSLEEGVYTFTVKETLDNTYLENEPVYVEKYEILSYGLTVTENTDSFIQVIVSTEFDLAPNVSGMNTFKAPVMILSATRVDKDKLRTELNYLYSECVAVITGFNKTTLSTYTALTIDATVRGNQKPEQTEHFHDQSVSTEIFYQTT